MNSKLEDLRSAEELRKRQASGVGIRTSRPDLRAEVLRLAAKRDRALGEESLRKLEEANEKEAEAARDNTRQTNSTNDFSASPAAAKRLALARRLLEDGDIERALEFAGPVLDQINKDSIVFLSALREKKCRRSRSGLCTKH